MKNKGEQPKRTCVGCGESKPKNQLVRFILSAQGKIELDYQGNYPARGAYLCPRSDCFEAAKKKGLWLRSFKAKEALFEKERLFAESKATNEKKILHLTGLAQRAGKLFSGADQVEEAISRGVLKLLVLAEDTSGNTFERFRGLAENAGIRWLQMLPKDKWGYALGKKPRAVIGIGDNGFADRVYEVALIFLDLTAQDRATRGD